MDKRCKTKPDNAICEWTLIGGIQTATPAPTKNVKFNAFLMRLQF